ncbi:hypothetical protein [Microvirga alba]|uniref:Chorismate lyase n=1 Tax=Microvirga alba TaxID=2791025 RepID=A0A931FND4_9HYPH|nr:hypothetical protein [Microvirga alba]MBF9232207.1 hypothetical protein [Microvirga alba]
MESGGSEISSLRITTPPDVEALIRELSARIAHARTATATLQVWCEEHGLSQGPITAKRLHEDRTSTIGDEQLPELGALPDESICHRRVQLVRGGLPLVEADNWFMPSRLPPEMRGILETTDLPFGVVIAPLNPSRRTCSIRFRAPGDGRRGETSLAAHGDEPWSPETILEHRAVVISGRGIPLAVVREYFRAELVSFAH